MSKRLICGIMLLTLFLSILLLNSGETLAHHDPHNPDHPTEITRFNPPGFYPGVVMAVEGGPFYPMDDSGHGSMVIFDGDETRTFFESPSRLVFVVPMYASCAPNHYVFVRNIIGTTEDHEIYETEREPVVVQCTEDRPYGPRPRIKEVLHSKEVTARKGRIIVKGFDILPFGPRDGFPHTLVHYTMDNIVGTAELTYLGFGEAAFTLNVDHCGTYNFALRNYYVNTREYAESSDFDVEVTNGCDDVPPIQGEYELSLVNMPTTAQIGENYAVTLNIGFTAPYDEEPQLEIFMNDELVDSRQISVNAHSITEYPLSVHFTEPGIQVFKVSIEGATAEATVEVSGAGSPANVTPTPTPPPSSMNSLEDFDTDGDCYINETEYLMMTDAWLAEEISESFFFDGTDAWIEQRNICATSANSRKLQVQQMGRVLVFSAAADVRALQIEIFNAGGRLITTERAQSNRLAWSMRAADGSRVANGVYFAKITQQRLDGSIAHELKKIAILR